MTVRELIQQLQEKVDVNPSVADWRVNLTIEHGGEVLDQKLQYVCLDEFIEYVDLTG